MSRDICAVCNWSPWSIKLGVVSATITVYALLKYLLFYFPNGTNVQNVQKKEKKKRSFAVYVLNTSQITTTVIYNFSS